MNNKEKWTAIWHAKNSTKEKLIDYLYSITPSYKKQSTKGDKKLAVVVGHNSKETGAYAKSPLSMSEYKLMSKVASEMKIIADNDPSIEVKVFKRKPYSSYSRQIKECYDQVNEWNPDAIMELHFNWLNGKGRIEMLHAVGSKEGRRLAQICLDNTSSIMGQRDGLKLLPTSKSTRGGASLYAGNAPTVLLEPFDCSNKEHVVKASVVTPRGFARTNIQTAKQFFTS